MALAAARTLSQRQTTPGRYRISPRPYGADSENGDPRESSAWISARVARDSGGTACAPGLGGTDIRARHILGIDQTPGVDDRGLSQVRTAAGQHALCGLRR